MAGSRRRKADTLIRRMRQIRGYLYPEWEVVARRDPDFFGAYDGLYTEALASNRGLSVKYRELVVLGILAFRGADPDAIANHVRRAFRYGATRAEVLGALEATIIPGGALTFLNGIRGLVRAEQVTGKGGQDRRAGRE